MCSKKADDESTGGSESNEDVEDESDESDECDDYNDDEDDREDEEPLSRAEARKAAMKAAAKKKERERKALEAECHHVWEEVMTEGERDAYVEKMLNPEGPIAAKIRMITSKSRSNFLYPMLKDELHKAAPELVPFTAGKPSADRVVYTQSKTAFKGHHKRMCPLLCGQDEDQTPLFYYTPELADTEPSPFVKYTNAIAAKCGIETIKPGLIAWLSSVAHVSNACAVLPSPSLSPSPHPRPRLPSLPLVLSHANSVAVSLSRNIAAQVANVKRRSKGRGVEGFIQGDLDDHTNWNAGIRKALKFMKSPDKCPTKAKIIKRIQKKHKKKSV